MPSEKVLEQKKLIVSKLVDDLKNSCAGVIVNYKGINVVDDTKLRKELREAGVDYFVVKNTLLRRAIKEINLDGLDAVLEGTTALAISKNDHVAAAKILCNFAEDHDFFKAKAGFVEGKVISVKEVNALAKLPTKEVLVSQVLRGLNAPITGLATVLNGTIRGLAIALSEVAKKQSA